MNRRGFFKGVAALATMASVPLPVLAAPKLVIHGPIHRYTVIRTRLPAAAWRNLYQGLPDRSFINDNV